jgi:hypothetical protein
VGLLRPYNDNDNPHKINVKPGSLGAIVRSYKSAVSYRINKEYNATGIWQRNYYERIIRNEPLPASPKYDEPPVVFGGRAR